MLKIIDQYPTFEEIESADEKQLCIWYKFLRSPLLYYGNEMDRMLRILERWKEAGGLNSPETREIYFVAK